MDNYYLSQANTGIVEGSVQGYSPSQNSHRHLGRGFISSALGLVGRALPYLGIGLLNTAVNVAEKLKSQDYDQSDVKERFKRSAVSALDTGLDAVKMTAKKRIMGSGRRRKYRSHRYAGPHLGGRRRKKRRSGKRRLPFGIVKGGRRSRRKSKFSSHLF